MYILNGNLYETEQEWISAIQRTRAYNVNMIFSHPRVTRQPAAIRFIKRIFYRSAPQHLH